jgi:3-oxoacyl-[acyl-carrier protein] reductase
VDELGFEPDLSGERRSVDVKRSVEPKIIVIAGASSGIGAALARGLSAAGHRVIACARSKERLTDAFRDCPEVEFATCDVADPIAVRHFCEFVAERTDHVDVLLNCAGGFGAIGAIDQVDCEEWMSTIRANLFGVFLATQRFLPLLEKSSAPQVISLSGGGAFSPFPNFSAYACSKAAIVRLTETLAIELAPRGIAVNALAPGMISTRAHEATLAAGPERAGQVQFQRTRRLMRQDSELSAARMQTVVQCVEALLSPEYRGLTGKTVSANFDPWASEEFRLHIADITQSDLYTMRRTNLVNLPAGLLRTNLMKVWAKHGIQR